MSFGTGHWLEEEVAVVLEGREILLSPRSLIEIVYDATGLVVWSESAAPILRTVATYCYLSGIFSSEDIETAAEHDPAVRYLCANHVLNWETVREFRRAHQSFLFQALSLAIEKLLRINPAKARWIATELLKRAVQADSAAMDT